MEYTAHVLPVSIDIRGYKVNMSGEGRGMGATEKRAGGGKEREYM